MSSDSCLRAIKIIVHWWSVAGTTGLSDLGAAIKPARVNAYKESIGLCFRSGGGVKAICFRGPSRPYRQEHLMIMGIFGGIKRSFDFGLTRWYSVRFARGLKKSSVFWGGGHLVVCQPSRATTVRK